MIFLSVKKEEAESFGWDRFVIDNGGCFLQSEEWKNFQENLSKEVFLFTVQKKETVSYENCAMVALGIKINLAAGFSYVYFPRGPVVLKGVDDDFLKSVLEIFFLGIKDFFSKEKMIFSRVEPQLPPQKNLFGIFKKINLKKTTSLNPSVTGILDITKTEEEIIASFKQKTRYNMRLAQKHGIMVSKNDKNFHDFWQLMKKTSQRNFFRIYSENYYKNFYDFSKKYCGNLKIDFYFAVHNKDVLAAAIIAIFGDKAYYLHGASSENKKNIMVPYVMHWEIIKNLKKGGVKEYDLWGMNPVEKKEKSDYKKSFEGITKFKGGFNPKEAVFAGTLDYVYDKNLYVLYKLARFLRRSI